MQTYLSILKRGREVPDPSCPGIYLTKLSSNRFIERCDLEEMAEFGKQLLRVKKGEKLFT